MKHLSTSSGPERAALSTQEQTLLSQAGIHPRGLSADWYIRRILRTVQDTLANKDPLTLTSEPEQIQDVMIAGSLGDLREQQRNPTWTGAFDLLQGVLALQTQWESDVEEDEPYDRVPQHWTPPQKGRPQRQRPESSHIELFRRLGFGDKSSAVFFREFRKYDGGVFHAGEHRLLFEYFLMLQSEFVSPETPEVYKSLKNITKETGVKEHSIQKFIEKMVDELGFLKVVRKGPNNQNYYSLNPEKINASVDLIFPPAGEANSDHR